MVVRVSLPGFTWDEVDFRLEDGVLSMKATHAAEHEDATERYYRRERTRESLSRRLALPGVAGDATVDATLQDGVLTLRLPLPPAAQPKRIAVHDG